MLHEGVLQRRAASAARRRPSIVVIVAALVLDRERQAREDALAVDQHGARAARALVAALLRAGELRRSRKASSRLTRGSNVSVWSVPLTRRLTVGARHSRRCGTVASCPIEEVSAPGCMRASS